ncbi:MAG: 3-phosphoshikimate 1-carboxyvinyltransferase, partial [Eubacteriales bacterium]|nr:3-phosphoshikimate 1-carboxyvinyltransferase [Eubacteriales bacterium]
NLLRQADSAVVLRCRESGSTLRFLIPFCLLPGRRIQLTGSGKLFTRPLSVYREICREQDLLFDQREASLTVEGRLAAGRYQVPGDISSQFISGLLFALPLLEKDSEIALTPPVESRPYIEMTMQALREAGVRTAWRDPLTIQIPGNQVYSPVDTAVEGDYSNAAFFEALNLTGGDVRVEGLRKDSLQGDRVYRQAFEQIRAGSARIDLSDCPDLGPVLMAAAALFEGAVFTGTRRLRIKESDRGEAMREELSKLGVRVDVSENEISVFPGLRRPREILDGHNDHRIVMALAVLLTKTGGSIRGAEAVKKSLPDFFERIRKLGIDVNQVTEGTGEAQER